MHDRLAQRIARKKTTIPTRQLLPNRYKLRALLLERVRKDSHKKKPVDRSAKDARIKHITAKRFGLEQGQHYPIEAIQVMADLGVVDAIRTLEGRV